MAPASPQGPAAYCYCFGRWLPSLLIPGLVVGLFILFILILAPNIANQAQALPDRLVGTAQNLRVWMETSAVLDALEGAGLVEKQESIAEIQTLIKDQAGKLPGAIENPISSLGSVLAIVTLLAFVPVILFYTLKDHPAIQAALVNLFPTAGGRRVYLVEAGSIVGRYFRGQLSISAIATFNVSVLLFVFDIPFWLLIGFLSGLLNLIPRIGPSLPWWWAPWWP